MKNPRIVWTLTVVLLIATVFLLCVIGQIGRFVHGYSVDIRTAAQLVESYFPPIGLVQMRFGNSRDGLQIAPAKVIRYRLCQDAACGVARKGVVGVVDESHAHASGANKPSHFLFRAQRQQPVSWVGAREKASEMTASLRDALEIARHVFVRRV
jgi:hypothetical protein